MLDFRNKVILAPMVRIGTLPLRLLSLRYGADIVYCEELVDLKLLRSKRIENRLLGTIDYVDLSDGSVVFRTCAEERDKVVLQIGTSSAERAEMVLDMYQEDVAAIDVNMGCPKEFSIKGGMGAALLDQPDKIRSILTTLTRKSNIPITCKIRVKPDLEETKELCRLIQSCGVAALAIHGRTRDERPRHSNRNDYIAAVAQILDVPVLANGGSRSITSYQGILDFKASTKAASVMVARAAEWNCSVFRKDGPLDITDVVKDYLKLCVDFDNQANNTKYTVQNMLGNMQSETPKGIASIKAQTLEELCAIWDLGDYFHEVQTARLEAALKLTPGPKTDLIWSVTEPCCKKLKLDRTEDNPMFDRDDVLAVPISFVRRHYPDESLPRTLLFNYARKTGKLPPKFETFQKERLFQSVLTFDGQKYTSYPGEKSRRYAEQAAALVYLKHHGMEPETKTIMNT